MLKTYDYFAWTDTSRVPVAFGHLTVWGVQVLLVPSIPKSLPDHFRVLLSNQSPFYPHVLFLYIKYQRYSSVFPPIRTNTYPPIRHALPMPAHIVLPGRLSLFNYALHVFLFNHDLICIFDKFV